METENSISKAVALIVEGSTEKVFYSEFIFNRARAQGAEILEVATDDGTDYVVHNKAGMSVLIRINNVGTVTQMVNSAIWLKNACVAKYPKLQWTVFLAYDTDSYTADITKFHEGDWQRLRSDITPHVNEVIDLAASADIEDLMLCDYTGILSFLGLPEDTELPKGAKGKSKMKKLYKLVSLKRPYHEGEKARPLIQSLDMEKLLVCAPVPLNKLEQVIFCA